VNRPLSSFLIHAGSLTSQNRESRAEWLDRLWLFESLMAHAEVRRNYPVVRWLRAKAVVRIALNVLKGRRVPADNKLDAFRPYVSFRIRGRHDRSQLFGSADDRGRPGETVDVSAQPV
jgi:hypothetical protein